MKFALHIVLILCCSTTFGHCVQNTADTRNISNVDSAKTDIFIVMDVSLSMLAQDFQPNRLEAVKDASKVFIDTQKNSRIGLVVFAGEAYTASVVTLDHISLKSAIDKVSTDRMRQGTAIGTALATATKRFSESEVLSKTVILLSDGANNVGDISPELAAEIAKLRNVYVYTIGICGEGMALCPALDESNEMIYQKLEVNIDETDLKTVAEIAGGRYFRAKNEESLKTVFAQIGTLIDE